MVADTVLFLDGFGFLRGWYVAANELVMAGPYRLVREAEDAMRAGESAPSWRALPPRRPVPVRR